MTPTLLSSWLKSTWHQQCFRRQRPQPGIKIVVVVCLFNVKTTLLPPFLFEWWRRHWRQHHTNTFLVVNVNDLTPTLMSLTLSATSSQHSFWKQCCYIDSDTDVVANVVQIRVTIGWSIVSYTWNLHWFCHRSRQVDTDACQTQHTDTDVIVSLANMSSKLEDSTVSRTAWHRNLCFSVINLTLTLKWWTVSSIWHQQFYCFSVSSTWHWHSNHRQYVQHSAETGVFANVVNKTLTMELAIVPSTLITHPVIDSAFNETDIIVSVFSDSLETVSIFIIEITLTLSSVSWTWWWQCSDCQWCHYDTVSNVVLRVVDMTTALKSSSARFLCHWNDVVASVVNVTLTLVSSPVS